MFDQAVGDDRSDKWRRRGKARRKRTGGKNSRRVTEDTERRSGRKRHARLFAAEEATGGLLDQSVGED